LHSVAIVGLGPKGLYCLERLCAEYAARPLRDPLHIHVFNRSAQFGTSPIYDPAEPDYILVNVSVAEIDLWNADDPPIACGRGPSFVDWYNQTFAPATPLTGDEYLARAVVGRYLIEGFRRIVDHLPAGVTVSCHVGEVVDIRPATRGYLLDFDGEEIRADKVLLATGHSRVLPGARETLYASFAARHPAAAFIPFVYPVAASLARVQTGARVAMLGAGLTFIDAVLELTEGRGGRFVRHDDGTLAYTASGNEPRAIFPFCRSGLPMTPKAQDHPPDERPLTFFTTEALAELQRRNGKLDLDRDLLPLIELEMHLHYCRVVMAAEDRQRLEACRNDAECARQVMAAYPFDFRQILDPIGDRRFASGGAFASFVEHYLEEEIARARLGQAGSGIKSAIAIWYEVRCTLGQFLPFGGLTPESHRKLVDHYYPRFKRVVFGPPIINIEKLLALVRAGLLDWSVARSPQVTTDDDRGCFELRCDDIAAIARAEVLIDARYPSNDLPRDATPLYRNLQRRGIVRPYENRSTDGGYSTGAIDMTEGSRFVVGRKGVVNRDIAVIGIPTEGNLVGNLTIARDSFSGIWAAEVMRQLRARRRPRPMQPAEAV
jgi:hypothetical protein